jgi:hypothetical protein
MADVEEVSVVVDFVKQHQLVLYDCAGDLRTKNKPSA